MQGGVVLVLVLLLFVSCGTVKSDEDTLQAYHTEVYDTSGTHPECTGSTVAGVTLVH